MVKDKPLTKTVLIKTLKEMGMVTKRDVREIVGEEIDSRKLVTKDDLKNLALKKDVGSLERRLVIRMNKMERGLCQSIADLAETTPTRGEFETLKRQSHYGLV